MDRSTDTRSRSKAYFKLAILLIFLISIPVTLYIYYRDTVLNKEWLLSLPSLLRQYRGYSAALLLIMQMLQVVICIIPGQPIQFAGSYMFGFVRGFIISIAGAVAGSLMSFYLARFLGKDALEILFGQERVWEYHNKLNSGRGLMAVLLIYLIPGVPKDTVSYIAGISGMHMRPFIIVSTIGRSPGMIGSLLLGYFYKQKNYYAIGILAVTAVIMFTVCCIKRKALTELLENLEKRDEERYNRKHQVTDG